MLRLLADLLCTCTRTHTQFTSCPHMSNEVHERIYAVHKPWIVLVDPASVCRRSAISQQSLPGNARTPAYLLPGSLEIRVLQPQALLALIELSQLLRLGLYCTLQLWKMLRLW